MLLDKYWKIEEELFPKNFFYRHSKLVAPDLIGCHLIKKNNEIDKVKGVIVETEAYSQEEEACHGYRKMTESNKSLRLLTDIDLQKDMIIFLIIWNS